MLPSIEAAIELLRRGDGERLQELLAPLAAAPPAEKRTGPPWQAALEQLDARLRVKPDCYGAMNRKGALLFWLGRTHEALACFRRCIDMAPDSGQAWTDYAYALNCDERAAPDEVLAAHTAYGGLFPATNVKHPNDPAPDRRLRVGYLGSVFFRHSGFHFIEPLIRKHDRSAVDVFCYDASPAADQWTKRLQAHPVAWRNVQGTTDRELAERIRSDAIDVLVETGGHGSINRLSVMALQPAPVQVSMPDYPNTTGLRQVTYKLTDARVDPPGVSDRFYVEELVRLPNCFVCYSPPYRAGAVTVAQRNSGPITFGSWNGSRKLNLAVVEVWAEILRRVPNSRLLLHHTFDGTPEVSRQYREPIMAMFRECKLSPARVDFVGARPLEDHLRVLPHADFALDTFPFSGMTTVCESLWMGVPVLTVAGNTTASRHAAGLLGTVGLHDWIAGSVKAYIDKAVEFAAGRDALSELRSGLRATMRRSPLLNSRQYAADVETAFRRMWRNWCKVGRVRR